MNYKFIKPTGQEHKVTVDSGLVFASWKHRYARGGTVAKVEVRTSFVGQGAQIEIIGEGDDYGKFKKKIFDKIYNNHYVGDLLIPEDIKHKDTVWFEVKLSKQGIKEKSNAIPALPMPILKKMQWNKKEGRQGEIVKLQVELEQVEDECQAKVVIFEFDQDGNHDQVVALPAIIKNRKLDLEWEYAYHEDVDEIPTEEDLKPLGKKYSHPEYFFIIVIDGIKLGEKQNSGLLTFKDSITLSLTDDHDNQMAGQEYIVYLADGTEKKGTLDSEGKATITDIPPGPYYTIFPKLL